MAKKVQISTTPLRIPEDLKTWLKKRADANVRSLNAEIIVMLLDERRKDELSGKEYLQKEEKLAQK
jgi:hypothetical protein